MLVSQGQNSLLKGLPPASKWQEVCLLLLRFTFQTYLWQYLCYPWVLFPLKWMNPSTSSSSSIPGRWSLYLPGLLEHGPTCWKVQKGQEAQVVVTPVVFYMEEGVRHRRDLGVLSLSKSSFPLHLPWLPFLNVGVNSSILHPLSFLSLLFKQILDERSSSCSGRPHSGQHFLEEENSCFFHA